jgi:hypothetical protein
MGNQWALAEAAAGNQQTQGGQPSMRSAADARLVAATGAKKATAPTPTLESAGRVRQLSLDPPAAAHNSTAAGAVKCCTCG